jgi:hypothetical protein
MSSSTVLPVTVLPVTDLTMLQSFVIKASVCLDQYEHDVIFTLIKTYLHNTYTSDFSEMEIETIESFKEELYNYIQSETFGTNHSIKILLQEMSHKIIHPRITAQYIMRKRLLMKEDNIGNLKYLPYDILETIANYINKK